MKEKLVIKNFGPIESVELELGRFNVLIGENGTGKSTLAKVLAICRYFSYIVPTNSEDETNKKYFENGLDEWGLIESLSDESLIRYECQDYTVHIVTKTIKQDKGSLKNHNKYTLISEAFYPELKSPSSTFQKLLDSAERSKIFQEGTNWITSTSFFINEAKRTLDNPFYVPTERGLQSLFSVGKDLQNFSDKLYEQLSKLDAVSKHFSSGLKITINDLHYKNENGKGYFSKDGEQYYSMSNAPSGIKSIIPLATLIEFYKQKNRKKTFIIEEPELNLFPSTQNNLMQFLVDSTMNYENKMLLTTHSPYILTSLNNMMAAYQAGQKDEEKVNAILDKKYWINPDDVSAYMMLADGTCEDIVDREEGIIKAEKIDGISEQINRQYSELLNIEFGID